MELTVYPENGLSGKKLLADYQKGSEEIAIYHTEREELEGKLLCVIGKNEKKELFRLGALTDREKGIYQLKKPLENSYKKIGTRIYPASTAVAGAEEHYFLPVGGREKEELSCICICERDGIRRESYRLLQAGQKNKIDFDWD